MIRPLLAEPGIAGCLGSVRVVHLGSEPLYRPDVEHYRERFAPGCLLVAGYGSTEFSPITEHHIRHFNDFVLTQLARVNSCPI